MLNHVFKDGPTPSILESRAHSISTGYLGGLTTSCVVTGNRGGIVTVSCRTEDVVSVKNSLGIY